MGQSNSMSTASLHSPPWEGIPATGPLLRPKAAATYLGYSLSRFYSLVSEGKIPLVKLGRGFNGASGVPQPWCDAIIAAGLVSKGANS